MPCSAAINSVYPGRPRLDTSSEEAVREIRLFAATAATRRADAAGCGFLASAGMRVYLCQQRIAFQRHSGAGQVAPLPGLYLSAGRQARQA